MKSLIKFACMCSASITVFMTSAFAGQVMFTEMLPGGFNVSINGQPLTPSGPLLVRGIVETTTLDINPDPGYGEFPLISATFTGAGFVDRTVVTPLSLVTFNVNGNQRFCFQLEGRFNQGDIGWNGSEPSPNFMGNINDLSTLFALPYTTGGTSTFWYDGLGANTWTLTGGDTIGANVGNSGPNGTFSITAVPEPSIFALLGLGSAALMIFPRRLGSFR